MKKLRFKRNIFNKDRLVDWAKSVKKRDEFACVACGYTGYLHSHHILPKSKFPKFAYEAWNGITLCKRCHLGSSGVHRSGTPRNSTVKELRELLKSSGKACVVDFRLKIKPVKRKGKVYKPYKRFRVTRKKKK